MKTEILREAQHIFEHLSDDHFLCQPKTMDWPEYNPKYSELLNLFNPNKNFTDMHVWFKAFGDFSGKNNLHRVYALLFMAAMCDD